MAVIGDNTIAQYAYAAGWRGNDLITAIAVCLAESGGDPTAKGFNRNASGQITSTDRGLWQINNVFHSEVSDACAYNPQCNASAAFSIYTKGGGFKPWSTFNSGAFRTFIQRATSASRTVGTPAGPTGIGTQAPGPPSGNVGGSMATALPLAYNVIDTQSANTTNTVVEGQGDNSQAYRLVLALLIMFAFIYILSKTRAGYAAIYYAEVLILFFLFVTQANFFKESLLPLASINQPNGDAGNAFNPQSQPLPSGGPQPAVQL